MKPSTNLFTLALCVSHVTINLISTRAMESSGSVPEQKETALAKATVEVSSLAELDAAAKRSNQIVTMKPGVYELNDLIPLNSIPERRARKEFFYIDFSGSSNVFNLQNVTIEATISIRKAFKAPILTDEFVISGNQNEFKGLTITNTGDASYGAFGALVGVAGSGNTLRDCTLCVRGSYLYGYGDLFGKGPGSLVPLGKHSGMHVIGSGTRVLGCKIFMRSYGHGFFVQGDCSDVVFEDCYVEGEMRSTDDILTEKSGPAIEVKFHSYMKNRDGTNLITAGYMKCLNEDGFRTYGVHTNLIFKNCSVKNMRGGFEVRMKTGVGVRLENCSALGCERGFWLSTGAVAMNCKGNAEFGPLLFLEGDHAVVDLEFLPTASTNTVHALAIIEGADHQVTIKPASSGNRTPALPIMLGFSPPGMGEAMCPINAAIATNIKLVNQTTMPVVISEKTTGGEVVTLGQVTGKKGKSVAVQQQ
jgi:hypothetical protein